MCVDPREPWMLKLTELMRARKELSVSMSDGVEAVQIHIWGIQEGKASLWQEIVK